MRTIKIISSFFLVLFYAGHIYCQEDTDERVKNLLLRLPELQKNEDNINLVETLIQVIEIKPDYIVAKKVLGGLISNKLDQLKIDLMARPGLLEKAINYSIDYISESLGTIFLLRKYYMQRDREKIRQILEKMIMSPAQRDLSSAVLLTFDPSVDKELYNEILQVLMSLVDNKSKINLLVYYYLTNQKESLINTIQQTDFNEVPGQIALSDILKLDPATDPVSFKLLFPKLMSSISENEILKIDNVDSLYILGKNFFFCGDELKASSIFGKIYSIFEKQPSEDYNKMFYWGICCLFKDQQYRAKLIFDQIYKFGDDSVRENFKRKLEWWNENLFYTSYTDELLKAYFGKSVEEEVIANKADSLSQTTTVNDFRDKQKIDGTYYALVIGIADYLDYHITSLFHPVKDAENFATLLKTNFTFDEKNITILKNPTRTDILKEIFKLRKNLNESDNLLIFYAGHGFWDEDIQQGYWLPSDAEYDDISNWISNSDIRDYIKGIKSQHTLLISDACFSGGIFKTRDVSDNSDISFEEMYKYISRRAITSGAIKTVPDKSVFIEYLMKRLEDDNEKYLTSQQLYVRMKEAVINNSPTRQTPLYGIIQETGDEGPGDFIFIKK